MLRKERLCGIQSGFKSIDEITKGWQPGETIAVAAAPGVGKTIFLYDCIFNSQVPVAVFTVGTPAAECTSRIIAKIIGVEPDNNSKLAQKEDEELLSWMRRGSEIYIDDTPRLDLQSFQRMCREQVENNGVKLIAISGPIQYMTVPKLKEDSTWKKDLLEIAEGISWTAQRLHVPIIFESKVSEGYRLRLNDYELELVPGEFDLEGGDVISPSVDKMMLLHCPTFHGLEGYYEDEYDRHVTRCFFTKGFPTEKKYVDLSLDWDYSSFKEYHQEHGGLQEV